MSECKFGSNARRPFLSRLANDTGGNTLAMMAAFMFPLLALTGSAVDVSRVYLVKVRLQQACDAGALAGRKFMTVTSGTTLDPDTSSTTPVEDQARNFFNNNFRNGWMGTSSVNIDFARASDGQVNATATATVPFSLMRMFGFTNNAITVTCSARMDIGDSDIMFVLDTTGSMACDTGNGCTSTVTYTKSDGTTGYKQTEESGSKIQAVRDAVLSFYDTLAANAPAAAHIRYGFVPYASSVNAADILQSGDLATTATYPSRSYTETNDGSAQTNAVIPGITGSSACSAAANSRLPTVGYYSDGRAYLITSATTWSSGNCRGNYQPKRPNWTYQNVTYDVTAYSTRSAITDPSKVTGQTTKWQGCIEERWTAAVTPYDVNNLPIDLDPDATGSGGGGIKPAWPDVTYYRPNTGTANPTPTSTTVRGDMNHGSGTAPSYSHVGHSSNSGNSQLYACPKAAKRLSEMTRSEVDDYVTDTDFVAQGYTYHDVGMVWGARLISPTGPYAADTAAWGGNSPPNRFLVFMSDGTMNAAPEVYGQMSLEEQFGRVTGNTGSNGTTMTTRHNARFVAVCQAARQRNVTVFVIALDTTVPTSMTQCATNGVVYSATAASLSSVFQQIALRVAKLRLEQ